MCATFSYAQHVAQAERQSSINHGNNHHILHHICPHVHHVRFSACKGVEESNFYHVQLFIIILSIPCLQSPWEQHVARPYLVSCPTRWSLLSYLDLCMDHISPSKQQRNIEQLVPPVGDFAFNFSASCFLLLLTCTAPSTISITLPISSIRALSSTETSTSTSTPLSF